MLRCVHIPDGICVHVSSTCYCCSPVHKLRVCTAQEPTDFDRDATSAYLANTYEKCLLDTLVHYCTYFFLACSFSIYSQHTLSACTLSRYYSQYKNRVCLHRLLQKYALCVTTLATVVLYFCTAVCPCYYCEPTPEQYPNAYIHVNGCEQVYTAFTRCLITCCSVLYTAKQ
jgi:hypothetical protein